MTFGFISTESLARASSRRPWRVIAAWLIALVAAAVLMVTLLGGALTTEDRVTNSPESKRADDLIARRLGSSDNTVDETVIVRSASATVDDQAYRGFVEGLFAELTGLGPDVVAGGVNYYMTGGDQLASADRHATLIPLVMPAGSEGKVEQIHEVVDSANKDPVFEVFATGQASLTADFLEISEKDLRTGEGIGISVALVVLALVFGAVAAAVLPIALAICAVLAALGATALLGLATDLSFFVTNMITMIGLAVGIDYSLFIVSRYREERARGLEKHDAIARAGATAGRAVLFSGMTVMLALVGLLIFPLTVFQSMGAGAILVVIAAVLASMTLLPAILGLMGDRVNAIRIPLVQRGKPGEVGHNGFWNWTTRAVMRRPVLSLVLAAGLLLAAATPYLDLNRGFSGIGSLPDGARSKEGFIVLQKEFGFGQDVQAKVVIDGDPGALKPAIDRLEAAVASDPAFVPIGAETHPEASLTVYSARLSGDPWGPEATASIARLRTQHIPAAFDGTGARVLVGGDTAMLLDFEGTTDTYTPIVFAFVLGLSFVLLTVAFRSIVVPVFSIIMNLLSVGAAYGLLVLVFQKGLGASIFGFQEVETVEIWLPLFLFAILFGLSMDYHVFLLSRIREHYGDTGDNTEAVAFGLRSTGRLITGAAAIMVAVFGGFALGDLVMMQQMGFGLAVAVFMDATVVRSVLVPSIMRLLGDRNWYFPGWLEWVPRIGIEGHGAHAALRAAGAAPAVPAAAGAED